MAIRMDKYHRLVSGGILPQLYWSSGGIYKSVINDAVFSSFEYSTKEYGNIQTVQAPALEWNVQTFERIDAPDFTQIVFPPEYLYKTCWSLYHRKNAKLLRYFAELFNAGTEWSLKKVHILVKSKGGGDTGSWGESTVAVVTLGEQEYRLPAGGQSVIDIATNLAALLNAEPSMNASAYQNKITIDLGARDRDFNVSLSVENPDGAESLTYNPAYVTMGENPGMTYGYAGRLYRTTDGKDLMRVVLIGASRELVGNESIPTLDDDDDNTPDLIAVMVDTQRKSWEYYTTKVRPLLRKSNLNNQIYSIYRLYGTVEATVDNLNINFEATHNFTVYTPEPIQMYPVGLASGDSPNPPFFMMFPRLPVDKYSEWVHEYASIPDVLYGMCGWIFRYQPLSYFLDNDLDPMVTTVGPTTVDGTIINYRIYLNESKRPALESSSFPGTKKMGSMETTIDGLLLNGDSSSSISIEVPSLPTEWERPDDYSVGREVYKLYINGLTDNTLDPYLGTHWSITEVSETFSYKPSKVFPLGGYDENEEKEETVLNFKYELKYHGQIMYTGIGLHVPPGRPPFIGYDHDPIGELRYYTAPSVLGELPYPVTSDSDGLSFNFRQYTGLGELPYRVGDFPIGHGLMTLIDTNIPDSLCYVHYAPGHNPGLMSEAIKYITEARSVPKELGKFFLGMYGIIWSHDNAVETATNNITTYKDNIDDGVYYRLTPQYKVRYESLMTYKQNSSYFTNAVPPLIVQHDQLYNQIVASDDAETIKQKEAERQVVLEQLLQVIKDYSALYYTVLVNNFASRELIESLEPGEFFIAPNF